MTDLSKYDDLDDLADEELEARLIQRGVAALDAQYLVERREDDETPATIIELLGW